MIPNTNNKIIKKSKKKIRKQMKIILKKCKTKQQKLQKELRS
jgi:hypothetical protein